MISFLSAMQEMLSHLLKRCGEAEENVLPARPILLERRPSCEYCRAQFAKLPEHVLPDKNRAQARIRMHTFCGGRNALK